MTCCPHCTKPMRKNNLSRHIRVQHGSEEPETCQLCEKVFKSVFNLKEHQRTMHQIFRTEK